MESKRQRIEGKFFPLTPELSQKLRKAELTKHEFTLWLYLTEKDPFGDRYWQVPSAIEIMAELGMSKASYFRAKAKLQKLELFDFQDETVYCRNLSVNSKAKPDSQNCDPSLKNEVPSLKNETTVSKMRPQSQKCEPESQKCDSRAPNPAPSAASKPLQTIQTYSDFKHTLSEGERENFEFFVRAEYRTISKGNEIGSFNAFMRDDSNFMEWKSKWDKTAGRKAQQTAHKWESDERVEGWKKQIEAMGNHLLFICESGKPDAERQDFCDWLLSNKPSGTWV